MIFSSDVQKPLINFRVCLQLSRSPSAQEEENEALPVDALHIEDDPGARRN